MNWINAFVKSIGWTVIGWVAFSFASLAFVVISGPAGLAALGD